MRMSFKILSMHDTMITPRCKISETVRLKSKFPSGRRRDGKLRKSQRRVDGSIGILKARPKERQAPNTIPHPIPSLETTRDPESPSDANGFQSLKDESLNTPNSSAFATQGRPLGMFWITYHPLLS